MRDALPSIRFGEDLDGLDRRGVQLTARRCLDVLCCLLAAATPLHALPDRAQQQARNEEVARVEQGEEEHPEQTWPAAGSRAHDQPRHAFCLLI